MNDINKERKAAVREAWKTERGHVRNGNGTRDWSQSEQRQILAKGKADGYEGHHMKSVAEHPQFAGDSKNIQFLNRSEHVDGAHRGSTQNPTNGFYDHKTGTMHDFGNRPHQAPQAQPLSAPLTQRQQNIAAKRERAKKQAAQQAKSDTSQPVAKITLNNQPQTHSTNQTAGNKGIESMRNKTANGQQETTQTSQNKGIEAARQKSAASPAGAGSQSGQSGNKGIQSAQASANGQSSGTASGSSSGGQSR